MSEKGHVVHEVFCGLETLAARLALPRAYLKTMAGQRLIPFLVVGRRKRFPLLATCCALVEIANNNRAISPREQNVALNWSIEDLGLDMRELNCLQGAEIMTVRQLVRRTPPQLLSIRAFGRTSLRRTERKLRDYGLRLGMRDAD